MKDLRGVTTETQAGPCAPEVSSGAWYDWLAYDRLVFRLLTRRVRLGFLVGTYSVGVCEWVRVFKKSEK